jgi:hypothetical protein
MARNPAHDDPEALFCFYQSFAHEPAGPSQNAIDGLAVAYVNLPQYMPLATSYVNELLRKHDTAHAVQILRRIAYAPHGGENAKRAQALLKEIEEKPEQETAPANAKP